METPDKDVGIVVSQAKVAVVSGVKVTSDLNPHIADTLFDNIVRRDIFSCASIF